MDDESQRQGSGLEPTPSPPLLPPSSPSLSRARRRRVGGHDPPSHRARRASRGVVGSLAEAFCRRHFPGVSREEWNDWRWQLRHRIVDPETLARLLPLTDVEARALDAAATGRRLPFAITPYYASLIDPRDPADPIRRATVPRIDELVCSPGEAEDPLGEDHDMAAPGLVHRYPDRVLLLATYQCPTYCRYCTRARIAGHQNALRFDEAQLDRAVAYVAAHPEVRDVLVSGGDPLTLADRRLEGLLRRLRAIDHVEIIRIGTKVPMALPQRITAGLVRVLRRFHPLWMSIHVTHPRELTPEVGAALARLADAGIPLGSQTVLCRGINDDPEVLKRLGQRLLAHRVRPYYLYQCDPVPGTGHLRTSVGTGLAMIEALRGHTTGYACPTYVIDAPGGGGKIPVAPSTLVGREGHEVILRNYEGALFRYPEPCLPEDEPAANVASGDRSER